MGVNPFCLLNGLCITKNNTKLIFATPKQPVLQFGAAFSVKLILPYKKYMFIATTGQIFIQRNFICCAVG